MSTYKWLCGNLLLWKSISSTFCSYCTFTSSVSCRTVLLRGSRDPFVSKVNWRQTQCIHIQYMMMEASPRSKRAGENLSTYVVQWVTLSVGNVVTQKILIALIMLCNKLLVKLYTPTQLLENTCLSMLCTSTHYTVSMNKWHPFFKIEHNNIYSFQRIICKRSSRYCRF